MSKGLKELEHLMNYVCNKCETNDCEKGNDNCRLFKLYSKVRDAIKENEYLKTELLGQSQELNIKNKVLKIIKEKQVDVLYIDMFQNSLDLYNRCVSFLPNKWCLTQEEFDLLKEVLL